ncbi:carboxypeptidase B-like [Diaphorina citri]|uniref:Carboxypeptidase B-like n=1 Tax=Diaphorina citri TaxID=121845 RepID=A0A3Q0JPZ2_DIACI|nr:carboxypeptidase B-like [Diaphorina citri]
MIPEFGITKLSENKIDENVNTTRLNHVEKVHQQVSGNSMDAEHDSERDKNYFRNQMTESETPRSSGTFILRDAEERILEEHNISNSSNGSIQNQIRINSYLKHIARIYGHKVNVSTIGETIEGRPIQAVKISHGGVGNPIIVLDGGIHAREWIAPATVLYVLQQLVENPENFPMFRKVDWILIPMLNPDGYVYSMTKDRMWRKNRARPRKSED